MDMYLFGKFRDFNLSEYYISGVLNFARIRKFNTREIKWVYGNSKYFRTVIFGHTEYIFRWMSNMWKFNWAKETGRDVVVWFFTSRIPSRVSWCSLLFAVTSHRLLYWCPKTIRQWPWSPPKKKPIGLYWSQTNPGCWTFSCLNTVKSRTLPMCSSFDRLNS